MPIGYITNLKRLEALIGNQLKEEQWLRREVDAGVCPGFVLRTLFSVWVGRNLKTGTYVKLGRVFNKPPSFFYELTALRKEKSDAEKTEEQHRAGRGKDRAEAGAQAATDAQGESRANRERARKAH
jgi:hypothetical protein